MTLLIELKVLESHLKHSNTDKIYGEIELLCKDFSTLNPNVLNLVSIINLGSNKLMEMCLGTVVRKLNKEYFNNPELINDKVLWLIISSALSRPNTVPDNSPSRITLVRVGASADWNTPLFHVLIPYMDKFLIKNLVKGDALIQEQTVDFFDLTRSYYWASRPSHVIQKYKVVFKPILDKVDDLELQEEWTDGVNEFLNSLSTYHKTQEEIVNYVFEKVESNQEIEQLKSNMLKLIHTNNKE